MRRPVVCYWVMAESSWLLIAFEHGNTSSLSPSIAVPIVQSIAGQSNNSHRPEAIEIDFGDGAEVLDRFEFRLLPMLSLEGPQQ